MVKGKGDYSAGVVVGVADRRVGANSNDSCQTE